ncbi:UDP-N-acetylglucosamine 1-carboxyvinyltransferase [Marinivivus vitaminiproducens]|uniref:UDP-N-acetylglucosamine 1-carboxyvinyltransferase n=1 Tax=Marinivivus vitaminiproducens TaxID=3035935 RepID=UPI0027A13C8F|nr:UDP-N-acetylglucosamine 1-carboxyvinyltransferase [Geminicoccaceae bacterium SCSIO 64248]
MVDKIRIQGGIPLKGRLPISGAKNAALPILAAALLTDEPLHLENVPDLADMTSMQRLLQLLGAAITFQPGDGRKLSLHVPEMLSTEAPYDLVRKMRASVLVLGPMLARMGQARVSLPGGCAIGPRPVDLHIKGLEDLGARITLERGYINAQCDGRLKGAAIRLPFPSVGATENLLMAATLAKGETVIANAAREPEIVDLAHCLLAMGARIEGIGSDTLHIQGVERLHGARHAVMADRIEAGTYVIAAAITRGDLVLEGASPELFGAADETLAAAGIELSPVEGGMRVRPVAEGLRGTDVMTQPFPGFPTDLQAQFMTLMCVADGAAMITETIFENRFMHVPELTRMGARITVHGGSALVRGVPSLMGAPVMASDLRASVSLVLAGLAAEGETTVNRIYHLDRGYERLEAKLAACGAVIERIA